MNGVIRAAVSLCTACYICVGFFGYVAFCTQNFTGNYNCVDMTRNEVGTCIIYTGKWLIIESPIILSSTFQQDFCCVLLECLLYCTSVIPVNLDKTLGGIFSLNSELVIFI